MRGLRVSFSGHATLIYPSLGTLSGNGLVRQYEDGKIAASVVLSDVDSNFDLLQSQKLNPTSFTLACPNGRKLSSTTWLTTGTLLQLRGGQFSQTVVKGLLTDFMLLASGGPSEARPCKYKFFITNLQFVGTKLTTAKYRNHTSVLASKLPLDVIDHEIFLKWAPSYEKAVQELRADRQARVTAVLELKTLAQNSVATSEELVDDICTIMSLASGNHVAWIEARRYDAHGRWLSSRHRVSVTRTYVPHPLLDSHDGVGLQRLAREGLPALRKWDNELGTETDTRPLRNAIRLALDARTESTYLQSRTLAALTVIELLTSKLMAKRKAAHLVSEDAFGKVQKAMIPVLEKTLKNVGCSDTEFQIMKAKLVELNRATLRRQIKKLMVEAGVDAGAEEVDLFIKVRNSIVHTGDYDKQTRLAPYEQHWAVLEFVDRLLLGLLGYHGKYISAFKGWRAAELR